MQRVITCLTILAVLSGAQLALAHGIPANISIDGTDTLYATQRVIYTDHDSVMNLTATDVRGTVGFYPEFGVFPTGESLSVDASGSTIHPIASFYWDGSDLLDSPVDYTLTRTGLTLTVEPEDTFVTGGALPAYNGTLGGHSTLSWRLPLDAPTGLYGVGFQVTAPGYNRSETFWAIGNYGVTDPAQVELGLAAIHAAVPEPSSFALGALSIGLTAGWQWHRRRRQRAICVSSNG